MIEAPRKPFAFVDNEIKLEPIAAASRGIRPRRVRHHRIIVAQRAVEFRLHPCRTIEKPGKLGQLDRPPVIEAAGRMPLPQQLCRARKRWRMRDLAQIDFLSGPTRSYRRRRRYRAPIGINSAQRIGMSTFAAARVEQEIVKIPEHELIVALRPTWSPPTRGVDLEQDSAIQQQAEKREPRKAVLSSQLFDGSRHGQRGDSGSDGRSANPEKGTGAWRLQHQIIATPAHIGEPRQGEKIDLVRPRYPRPVVGDLRLDNDPLSSRALEAVLQQTVPRQSADQGTEFF